MGKKVIKQVATGLSLVLCVLLSFLLFCNVTIIIQGTLHPETPPSVFGVTPMVVLSGSMSGNAEDHIEVGDLIFVTKPDLEKIKEGDIVSFTSNKTIITHRIIDIFTDENGEVKYITKGDANNVEDDAIAANDIIGSYWFRIPKLGDFALFMQEPLGMVIFIGIPIFGFVIYDILNRRHRLNQDADENARLKKELEELKASINQKN